MRFVVIVAPSWGNAGLIAEHMENIHNWCHERGDAAVIHFPSPYSTHTVQLTEILKDVPGLRYVEYLLDTRHISGWGERNTRMVKFSQPEWVLVFSGLPLDEEALDLVKKTKQHELKYWIWGDTWPFEMLAAQPGVIAQTQTV